MTRSVAFAESIGNERFGSYTMHNLARVRFALGDRAGAIVLLDEAVETSRRTGITFVSPRVLGAVAYMSDDPQRRKAVLAEGEEVLASGNCISHNHFWFYRFAIDSALADRDWEAAERYAEALDAYTEAEGTPWTDLHIARGRLRAALGRDPDNAQARGELTKLCESAKAAGQLEIVDEMAELLAD